MREQCDLKCDCESCLMMCEPYDDARIVQPEGNGPRHDIDDPWILYFGCEMTRRLQ